MFSSFSEERYGESLKMKLQTASFLLVLTACVHAERVVVDDPGMGNTVNFMELVPNMLGYPDAGDPYLKIVSPVPVSILRSNDNVNLAGGPPVQKEDIYVIVKSNCTTIDAVLVDIEYMEYNRSAVVEWDTAIYTDSISLSIVAGLNVTLVDSDFLVPSSFLTYWNYTPQICLFGGAATDPPTGSPSFAPSNPQEPDVESNENALAHSNPTGDSASASKSGILITLMAALASTIMVFRDGAGGLGKRGGVWLRVWGVLAMAGVLLVSLQADAPNEGTVLGIRESPKAHSHGRRSLEAANGEICAANVEIVVNGCRRVFAQDTTDLEVSAPKLRIIDVMLTELNSTASPNDPCTTDYVGIMEFNATNATFPTINNTSHTYMISALSVDECARPFVGRPFVDVHGHSLQASVCVLEPSTPVAWSAAGQDTIRSSQLLDPGLGQEWADRALGEHASVPAFAAFTIALMSNNAPPSLVQDALTAAMDEVRHAKTSFEVASLLLGKTVEPGPVPPSVHSFGPDKTALAVAAAQEGCIDETLSALVAAYDVDARLPENSLLDETTKSDLKDKMRTIALEECTHSALAWRTVRWACQMDSEVCSVVKTQVFTSQNLMQAFEKQFGPYGLDAKAQSAWETVYRTLIPFVLFENNDGALGEMVDCNEEAVAARELAATGATISLLEEMAMTIIQKTFCANLEP